MPNDNRVSATITDDVKNQILVKFQEIADLLPFLSNLGNDEKKGITTIGTEREAMDNTFNAEMAAHPDLVPSYVDKEELARDRELRADLLELMQRAEEIRDALEDTAHEAGSDVLMAYLSFYNSVKQAAKRDVAGANTLYSNLSRFFPKRGGGVAAPIIPAA